MPVSHRNVVTRSAPRAADLRVIGNLPDPGALFALGRPTGNDNARFHKRRVAMEMIRTLTAKQKALWAVLAVGVVALTIWLVMYTPVARVFE